MVVGITTAAGVGLGYPLAGLLAQYLGLSGPFTAGGILSGACLLAAAIVLPSSPRRTAPLDPVGAVLLAAGVVALMIAVAQGPTWGWGSWRVIAAGGVAVVALPGWTAWELHTRAPLVELRMLRQRSVLAGNLTGALVALGFYPFMSLVVRFVQTPPSAGYGFGASTVLAGMMLTPFSAASFAARRPAIALARRTSPAWAIAASSLIIAVGQLLFLLTRSGYPSVIAAMTLTGLGVGAVFAINPIQIVDGAPTQDTGSAISFYQLLRTVGYSLASALSATVLIAHIHPGQHLPPDSGYSAALLVDLAILAAALLISSLLALRQPRRTGQPDLRGARAAS